MTGAGHGGPPLSYLAATAHVVMFRLLRDRPPLRRFLAAFLQSQLGTGAAFVALPLVAYQRLHSSWGISLVLLSEFLPGIVLTPLSGSLADRCSRRHLAVCADLFRAGCFLGIALSSSFELTVLFALASGVGSSLFRPAINAALPGLVDAESRSKATAMFCGCANVGLMIGPGIAAGILLVASAPAVLLADAATFLVSAALISGLELGPDRPDTGQEADGEPELSILSQTRAGVRAAARLPGVPIVLGIASLAVLTDAMSNVTSPLLATGPLHAGGSGYGVLIAAFGAGSLAGSLISGRAGSDIARLSRIWVWGIASAGVTMTAAAFAPGFAFAVAAFLLIGAAETVLVGTEMRLIQELVPERFLGRVFGLKDMLENLAFVLAFVTAGGLVSLTGTRATFAGAGLLTLALSAGAARRTRPAASPAGAWQGGMRRLILSKSPSAS